MQKLPGLRRNRAPLNLHVSAITTRSKIAATCQIGRLLGSANNRVLAHVASNNVVRRRTPTNVSTFIIDY